MEQYAGELQKIWDNALVRAAENRQRAQSGQETGAAAQIRTEGQYEIRYPTYTDEQMEKNAAGLRTMKAVAKVTGDELGPRSISIKERVTKYFASLGNNVHTEAFGDVALSNSSVHSEIRHGHTSTKVATYAAIPEVLRSGVVIYRKEKNRHGLERIVVAAPVEVGTNAEKMYVGVMLQRDPQTQRLYLHDAVTEKEPAAQTDGHLSTTGPNGMESELYTTSILRNALNVKKNTESKPAGALLQKSTHATPIESASKDSIRPGNEKSNSVRDNTGRELTPAQQEYFRGSKARDENGNLLVMYHQTDGDFTVFDTEHKGAGTGDDETPFGVFLKKTSRDIGVRGKKQMQLYANIQNPLRVDNREQLVQSLARMSEEYASLKAESGNIDKEYGAKFEKAKRAFVDFLTRWRKENPDAPARAAYNAEGFDAAFNAEDEVVEEWTKKQDALALKAKKAATAALRENGYDGVFLEKDQGSWGRSTEAYIALDPAQVKNIDNLTPTGDPDIRYQARDSADDGVVSIKRQLKDAQKLLEGMSAVTRKLVFEDVAKMSAKQRLDWAVNELKSSGYRVERPDGKIIEFGPKDINSGLRYLDSAGEVAAYTALPAVLKRGRVIYAEGNHKGRGYGTITIAAPVEINGVRGNMAVVVRQTKGHRYDVHRILMPDGSAFIFREKANAVSTTVGSVTGDAKAPGEVRPTINTASTDSIRSSAGNSQEKFSVREAGITDRELLANALETTAQNAEERRILKWYREVAKSLTEHEQLLENMRQRLADHKSGEKALSPGKVKDLEDYTEYIVNKLDEEDRKLLKIESMGPVRKLLEREREYVERRLAGAREEKDRYRADFEQRLQEARRREQESLIQYRERREESERRRAVTAKIERTTRQLADRLNTNTDKKHIPEPLKKPVAQLLTALDYSSRSSLRGDRATRADQEYCRAMEGIRRVLAEQEAFQQGAEGSEDALGGYLDLPPGLTDLMTKHIQTVENIIEDRMPTETVLRRMNLTQLNDLDVILSTVTRAVTKMNELLENRTFVRVADAAEDTMAELHRRGQHKGTAEKAETFVAWDNTLPWYAFQRFGQGGRAIFGELQDGWDKLAFNSKQVLDFRRSVITDEQARAWDTEVRQVELLDQEGETATVSMTTAQLMGLYCLSKRKQALGHLFGGGIRITDIETQGKLRKKTIKQDEHYKMDDQMLGRLLGQLTPEQIVVADKLQKYMTEQGSKWGNEVTMKRFGYRGFTEKIYYPIETDSQDRLSRAGDGTEGSLYRLQNISAVKPLVQNANNAIMLRGIFDVFSNHMADMAKYNALVIPIVDAQKWYNYKDSVKNEAGQVNPRTVQRAMTKAYGQSANRYVVQFLKDLNGVKESGARGEGFANKMISNYKRAAVAANLRVALLQPTAYVRAAAVLDYKYLAKAFGDQTGTRQATAEMLEHSGIALWKDMGFFDTDVGRSIRDQIKGKGSKLEDLVDKSMAAAELGDKITWARLWRACKLEVQEKHGLSGDELIKATAQRFRDVIYQTQVIDSTMTRSHIMRSYSTFSKMFTSFMSEPTVSYNLIMEGTRQILKDKKAVGLKTAIGRNWKTAGRAYQAYVVSALAAAVVESLADALRDDDDDTLWEKLWSAFGGLHGNLASDLNPLNKLPYMRDVFSALDGYDNGRMDTEALANLKKAYDILMESYRLATGQQDKATSTTYYGNMTTYGKVYQTFRAVSMLSGLPLSAATREVITAWNNTVGSVWPGMKRKTYESKKLREAYNSYAKPAGISYDTLSTAMEYVATLESDKDAEGKTVSGSLKAKYVAYIQSLGLTSSQQKAMWLALKNSTWSDKGTPWE